jgi:CRP/FNR family transcriptional regulator, anaerobic regulatory protein
VNTNEDFRKLLLDAFQSSTKRTFSKNEFLIREGEVEKNVYFIESGLVRVFLLSEFEDQTIRFGYTGSIINSLASFVKGTPSEFYIEPLRKTVVRTLTKETFHSLVYKDEKSLRSYIQLLELSITQQIDREIDILTPSPTERLRRVLDRSPNLFQEVPLKYIASYLRMTPETLSRIRNS